MKRFCLLLIALLTVYFSLAQATWNLEILVPISNPAGERVISLDRYPRFHIALENVSGKVQRLWKDWNTWGFFNLTLTWRSSNDLQKIYKKTPAAWDGDFPDFWVIPPGETLILEIDMSTGVWEGIPDLYGERIEATLQATYENKRDGLANDFGIWVGKVTSNSVNIVFE